MAGQPERIYGLPMTGLAFVLVITSAFLHAYWNLLAKRAGGGASFVWAMSLTEVVVLLPVLLGVFIIQQPAISAAGVAFTLGSSVLHVLYYLLLTRAYTAGDMSLVYPLSRGTGPTLSILGAVLVFGERPGVLAVFGALLVVLGVFMLTGNPFKLRGSANAGAILYGLLTGLVIAVYTLTDKQVVGVLSVPPLFLLWVSSVIRTTALTPYARRHWPDIKALWQQQRPNIVGVAVFDSLSYTLFLVALSFGQVSYLSPARQVSILFGAILGARFLAEGNALARVGAALVMLIGLMALTLN